MLAKITRANQVTIPKAILKQAHLTAASPYVKVEYAHGVIYLKPVVVEERLPTEQLDKFQSWALQEDTGDLQVDSLPAAIRHFKKRLKNA